MNRDLSNEVLKELSENSSTRAFMIEQARGHIEYYESQLKYWNAFLSTLEGTSTSQSLPIPKAPESGRLVIPKPAPPKGEMKKPEPKEKPVIPESIVGEVSHVVETEPEADKAEATQPLTVEIDKDEGDDKAGSLSHFSRPSVKNRSNKFVRKVNFDDAVASPSSMTSSRVSMTSVQSSSQSFEMSTPASPSNTDFSKTRSAAFSFSIAHAASSVVLNSTESKPSPAPESTTSESNTQKSVSVSEDAQAEPEPQVTQNKFAMFENMSRNSAYSTSSRVSSNSILKTASEKDMEKEKEKEMEKETEKEKEAEKEKENEQSSSISPTQEPDASETTVSNRFAMFENKAKLGGASTLPLPNSARGRSQTYVPLKSSPSTLTPETNQSSVTKGPEAGKEASSESSDVPAKKDLFAMFSGNPDLIPMRASSHSVATPYSSRPPVVQTLPPIVSEETPEPAVESKPVVGASGNAVPPPVIGASGNAVPPPVMGASGNVVPPPVMGASGNAVPPPVMGASGHAIPPPVMGASGNSVPPPVIGSTGPSIPKTAYPGSPPPLGPAPLMGPKMPSSGPPKLERVASPGPGPMPPNMPPPSMGGPPPKMPPGAGGPPPMMPPSAGGPPPMMPPSAGGPPPMMPPSAGGPPPNMPPPSMGGPPPMMPSSAGGPPPMMPPSAGGPPPMMPGIAPPRGGMPVMGVMGSDELAAALNRRKQTEYQ